VPEDSYGAIHRYEPARESTVAAITIVVLSIMQIVLVGLFTYGLTAGWAVGASTGSEAGNVLLGLLLAGVFVNLAFILLLYRKEFLPDVMVVKKRRRKWEDLYVEREDMYGEEITDGAIEKFKRAVYPYYRK
jgi:Zn-dependent protease with chaperone function